MYLELTLVAMKIKKMQEWLRLCVHVYFFFRNLSINTGECDVPSQPMLEWLCLKVLGAAQLMSCTLNRCSRAFVYPFQMWHLYDTSWCLVLIILCVLSLQMCVSVLHEAWFSVPSSCYGFALIDFCLRFSKQQIKWEEFIVLNVVITSMLSRLWWVSFPHSHIFKIYFFKYLKNDNDFFKKQPSWAKSTCPCASSGWCSVVSWFACPLCTNGSWSSTEK